MIFYSIKENVQPCIDFLKPPREDVVLDSAGRLFHSLAPRKEKHFCPFADLSLATLNHSQCSGDCGRSMLREEHAEFLVKRLHKY